MSYGTTRCLHLCLAVQASNTAISASCNRGRRYCLFFIAGGISEEWSGLSEEVLSDRQIEVADSCVWSMVGCTQGTCL